MSNHPIDNLPRFTFWGIIGGMCFFAFFLIIIINCL